MMFDMNNEILSTIRIIIEATVELIKLLWSEYNVPVRKLARSIIIHTIALCMMVYETTRDKQWSSLLRSSLNLQRLRTAWQT